MIAGAGGAALGRLLVSPECRLEELYLDATRIGDAGGADGLFPSAADASTHCLVGSRIPTGENRSLSKNTKPPRSSGAALASGLEAAGKASRLRRLDLSSNGLADAAAEALGRALAAQGGEAAAPGGAWEEDSSSAAEFLLRWLSLADNLFGPEGARLLAQGIRASSSLETLDLGGNAQMGVAGVAAIAAATVSGGSGDGEGGGGAMAAAAPSSCGLKTLRLARCALSDAHVDAMLRAGLERADACSLRELDVRDNDLLTEAGYTALASWAPLRRAV